MENQDLSNEEATLFGMIVWEWVNDHPNESPEHIDPYDYGISSDQLWIGIEYFYFQMGYRSKLAQ